MSIITTRYRDIPWDDVPVKHRLATGLAEDRIDWEDEMRGQTVQIIVPALHDTDGCGGPWYRIAGGPVRDCMFVCPHLAEIGD